MQRAGRPRQGEDKPSPIYTNLRKAEFVAAGDDRRCRSTKCPRLVRRRLLVAYRKRSVSPFAWAGGTQRRQNKPLARVHAHSLPSRSTAGRPDPGGRWACSVTCAHAAWSTHHSACFSSPAYQLKAHSTACRSSSCAELGRVLRLFI